jgi:L-ascorbate metabolism protein UlaG (beta-lactamase superfamily)
MACLLIVMYKLFFMIKIFGSNPNKVKVQHSINYKDGAFNNLEHTIMLTEEASFFQMTKELMLGNKNRFPNKAIPSVKSNLNHLNQEAITWLGHSSYHLYFSGKHILVDPVFSGAAAPFSFMIKAFEGSNNYQPNDFEKIDFLILTHDHYDHLDYHTLLKLKPKIKYIYCSLGVAAHLVYWGFDAKIIHELDWWQSKQMDDDIKITATPARHFSGRGIKRAQTLWSSFVLESSTRKLFLGGDSGYGHHFAEIGNKFGSFDLAILECGQYNERWPMIHMMPEQTVQAGIDLGAKIILPVHWGKFALAYHVWDEPINRFSKKANELKIKHITPQIGESYYFDQPHQTKRWWSSLMQ